MVDKPNTTDFRWIGREGEKVFSLLCTRRMVTCNKADEDDLGWDFIVQLPRPAILQVPIDQRSAGVAALVQMKATSVGAERWSISLKNALSLARSPLPAFIVCVGLDGSGRKRFHAVHIWRDEIARILKAARQAHVDGDEATNRRTVSFGLGLGAERTDVLGWMLKEILTIGDGRYATAKQLLVDTLGFEEGHGVARFRFSTASPDALAELQLGVLDGLDLGHFTFTPSRFGIEAPTPEIELQGGRLEVFPRGRSATLRLRSPDGQQELVPAQMFSAALPGRRRSRVRIKAGFLDLMISSKGRFSVKSVPDRDERTTLEHIGALALLYQSSRAAPLTLGLKSNQRFGDLGRINIRRGSDPGWQQLLFITRALRRIVAFEGTQPIVTSINAIDDQFVLLSVLDALVAERALRIEFTPLEDVEGEVGAFLSYTTVSFDGMEVGAVATRPVIADVMIGARRRIDFGPATILHATVDDGRSRTMHKLYLDELDRLSEAVDVLAIGDLQRSVNREDDRELLIDEPRHVPQRRLALSHPNGKVRPGAVRTEVC